MEVWPVSGMEFGQAFLTALVVWLAALMTPGPDFAATVHASVGGSRRSGLAVGAGVTVGMAAWATASLFGFHAVLLAFEGLVTAVRLAGAAYLTYVGVRLLLAAWQGDVSHVHAATPRSVSGAFRHGLFTNLANPKALALFGSLFAVLVPLDAPPWFSIGFLVAVIVSTAAWYALVAVTMSTDAIGRGYRRIERGINAATGVVFVAVGARLASEP
jgi:threonine efflux protein